MRFSSSPLVAVGALALASTWLASNDARACGGCFHVESQTESTVVTAHRMAFAVSPTHTVLWDQVQYAGNPSSFAWVLPVKPGARRALHGRLVRGARRGDLGPRRQPADRLPRDGLVRVQPRL